MGLSGRKQLRAEPTSPKSTSKRCADDAHASSEASATTRKLPCEAGGQLGMWKSPALRGPKANWEMVGPVFTSNATVLSGAHLVKEFVTIDLIGTMEGDPAPASGTASGTRLFLNNVGGNGGGQGC